MKRGDLHGKSFLIKVQKHLFEPIIQKGCIDWDVFQVKSLNEGGIAYNFQALRGETMFIFQGPGGNPH